MKRLSETSRCSGRLKIMMPVFVGLAFVAVDSPATAQVTSRTVVVTQTQALGSGSSRHTITRNVTTTTIRQSLAMPESVPAFGSVVPFGLLPVVGGIRTTPVAPPTVYRIAGPRTAMHEADEQRMQQINPGARVITPDDLSLTRETRRRYAVAENGNNQSKNYERGKDGYSGHKKPSQPAYRPRVIVILPE